MIYLRDDIAASLDIDAALIVIATKDKFAGGARGGLNDFGYGLTRTSG